MRYPVIERITLCPVLGLGPIVGRSALFMGRATLVAGRDCCADCVESNIGYCNNYVEHWLFDVNTALTLSL